MPRRGVGPQAVHRSYPHGFRTPDARPENNAVSADAKDHAMPLGEHLEELRRRIILALVGVLPIFILGLVFGHQILMFLTAPLERALGNDAPEGGLQVTSVLEGFNTYVKVAALLAAALGAPWILYQVWRFIAPGLYAREKRFVNLLAPMSVALTLAGLAFMYYIMLPAMLHFFVVFNKDLVTRPPPMVAPLPEGVNLPSFPVLKADPPSPVPGQVWINEETNQLRVAVGPATSHGHGSMLPFLHSSPKPEAAPSPASAPSAGGQKTESSAKPSTDVSATSAPVRVLSLPLRGDSLISQHYKMNEYLSLVLMLALAFVVTFQTPIVVLLLGWAGLIKVDQLSQYRRWAIMVCTVVSALVTPADLISMLALGIPMYLLYELGGLLLRVMPARRVAAGAVLTPWKSVPDPFADDAPVEDDRRTGRDGRTGRDAQ